MREERVLQGIPSTYKYVQATSTVMSRQKVCKQAKEARHTRRCQSPFGDFGASCIFHFIWKNHQIVGERSSSNHDEKTTELSTKGENSQG